MRQTKLSRALTACCAAAVVIGVVAGCGDDDDSSDASSSATTSAVAESTAATSSAAASAADPAVTKEITDAYTTFFNGKTPAADRTALIENPDGFSQVLVGMASDTRAQGTGVTVKGVTLTDDTNADVSYDLLLNGTPVMPDQTGQAIKVDGKWKVASSTFCALLSIQGTGAQIPACS
ncbi:hypothetical protein GII30_05040 [Gordonia amarae]|uniref:Low molecular weight antigen MTB12-like C-terminal domain-containing protein n=2 Tax=Gordonia amarae TaxID=36821 RepID=G7GTW4_9ACTN|nr:hypothetical protein [Gordonia amarae]MCS3877733.1 hypothetical protein [Gordonia amarae]QHN16437.1 hypothetical protein GII35_05045 [Gordonia amarae]QHN21006.1 hypothetical protein GII34_05045 [Gordonia amarae]QHN29858.1 hypothetical protein GII32_05055 [Gordonia amarae]QHN38632.1 hypothetical protein GII30_05040 [Gordonia amarae]